MREQPPALTSNHGASESDILQRMALRTAALLCLPLAGCFSEPDGSATGNSTSASEGSEAAGTADSVEPTTSGEDSSDTSASASTTSVSSSSDGSDGSSSTGDPPNLGPCWESDAPWQTQPIPVDALTGESPTGLALSPNGLTLRYVAGEPDPRLPYEVRRTSRMEGFSGGEPLPGWNNPAMNLAQVRVAEDGERLVARVGSELHVSSMSGDDWQSLAMVDFGPDFDELTDPSLDSQGRILVFTRPRHLRGHLADRRLDRASACALAQQR